MADIFIKREAIFERALNEMCTALGKKDPYIVKTDPYYWIDLATAKLSREMKVEQCLDILYSKT